MGNKKIILILILKLVFITSNTRLPIVGILSYGETVTGNATQSFVDASLVRWLEASGADSVVIHPWFNEEEVDTLLTKVNGILIQTADAQLSLNNTFIKRVNYVVNKIIKIADANLTKIPIMAIGEAFQILHYIFANEVQNENFGNFNRSIPLFFNQDFLATSKLFSLFEEEDFVSLMNKNVAYFDSKNGIPPESYQKLEILEQMFTITTTAKDDKGKTIIASIEGDDYPIFGLQFQPDFVSFERNNQLDVNHSISSVRIARALGNVFVEECKKGNSNSMNPEDYFNYNYIDTYTEYPTMRNGKYTYVFKKE